MAAQTIDRMLGIKFPIIMAPMFLISNSSMVIAALKEGITAAFPALNYRTDKELRAAIAEIRAASSAPFGVNLIVNKSNLKYHAQLDTLIELRVPYIITSLGSPKETIERCRPLGIRVFCDVTNLEYAQKVVDAGADALVAVNGQAGGHAGYIAPQELVRQLTEQFPDVPVISAGGIGTGSQVAEAMSWGAAGVQVGTIFIASEEAPVSQDYKQALVTYDAEDIVRTTRLSGSPLTVINTPYVQKMGTEASWWERLLLKNKRLKKWTKMFIALRGMRKVEASTYGSPTYKTVWCAGPAIRHVHSIRPLSVIIRELTDGYEAARQSSGG
ncbi:MAG: NAD(P)H-dependent flavin oxidoreductase [Bacteroidota bacterium]